MLGPSEGVSAGRQNNGSSRARESSGERANIIKREIISNHYRLRLDLSYFFHLIYVAGGCAAIKSRQLIVTRPSEKRLCSLLAGVASGDRKAFRTLYDKSAPVLFAICVRLMRDRDVAQDVLQEAMTRIWRKAHLFDASKGNALVWMAVVTRNCALSHRAAAPPPSSSLDEGVLAAVVARSSNDPVIAADVRQCLKKLNEKYRKCVTLVYLHGLSYEELAEQMGAPLGSVKSWVHRAVRELAHCMGK
jgi:RNA polymerase sigma-70 factor (ECF subfamily)